MKKGIYLNKEEMDRNSADAGKVSIEACECPGCLNTTQVRAGRVAKCRYCARLLEAPIILSN